MQEGGGEWFMGRCAEEGVLCSCRVIQWSWSGSTRPSFGYGQPAGSEVGLNSFKQLE